MECVTNRCFANRYTMFISFVYLSYGFVCLSLFCKENFFFWGFFLLISLIISFNIFQQVGIGEVSTVREAPSSTGTCESDPYERTSHAMVTHQQPLPVPPLPLPAHPQIAASTTTTAFHINQPSNPISAIMAPPPLHHTSIILDDHDSYHVSRMMLQSEFQVTRSSSNDNVNCFIMSMLCMSFLFCLDYSC